MNPWQLVALIAYRELQHSALEGMLQMTRFLSIRLLPLILLSGVLGGCGEGQPVRFTHDSRLSGPEFENRPKLRARVVEAVDDLFGASPDQVISPEGSGLASSSFAMPEAGLSSKDSSPFFSFASDRHAIEPAQDLYRKHCMHCHGVSGDGMGPTAPYVYPVPRDYRQGRFKFTSTGYGNKPSRDDLRRVIANGLDGTSMPAFSAQLSPEQIERLVDYVTLLSMRGEVEIVLTEEATAYEDSDLDLYDDLLVEELASSVFSRWEMAQDSSAVTQAASPRVEPTTESVARGRELFLGTARDVKLECVGCHGPRADGNGTSWIDPETFNRLVFGGRPGPAQVEELKNIADQKQKRWSDDWGNPLRPADLNKGIFKGGRRPIDLYWRIANGINGTPMPAHASILQNPEDIWHLVNFLLALPNEPELLVPTVPRLPVDLAGPHSNRTSTTGGG